MSGRVFCFVFLLLAVFAARAEKEVAGAAEESPSVKSASLSSSASSLPSLSQSLVPPPPVPACSQLHPLLFQCEMPEFDAQTQQPLTCMRDNSVLVHCQTVSGAVCDVNATRFTRRLHGLCSYGAHAHHSTALLLSIFCGLLGIDRFYLGYYAIGLFKMFSLGGLFIVYIVDVILIALQQLTPADGTGYIINAVGPKVMPLRFDNETYIPLYSCPDCY